MLQCCIHFSSTSCEEIVVALTDKTFKKVIEFALKWVKFVCLQGDVARDFGAKVKLKASSPEEAKSAGFGIHRKCYARFADSTRLQRFETRASNDKKVLISAEAEVEPAPKRLRSSSIFSNWIIVASTSSQVHSDLSVLPPVCIICKRERKEVKNRVMCKRIREKLQQCKLTYNHMLLKAAQQREDEDLLCLIRDKDLVAIGVKYHHSCYMSYTDFLRYNRKSDKRAGSPAYTIFKKEVVHKRIIKGGEVLCLTKLAELYKQTVRTVEDKEILVRPHLLKYWLSKDLPQLTFTRPKHRNTSEIIMSKKTVPNFLIPSVGDTETKSKAYSDTSIVADPPKTSNSAGGGIDTFELQQMNQQDKSLSSGSTLQSPVSSAPKYSDQASTDQDSADCASSANSHSLQGDEHQNYKVIPGYTVHHQPAGSLLAYDIVKTEQEPLSELPTVPDTTDTECSSQSSAERWDTAERCCCESGCGQKRTTEESELFREYLKSEMDKNRSQIEKNKMLQKVAELKVRKLQLEIEKLQNMDSS